MFCRTKSVGLLLLASIAMLGGCGATGPCCRSIYGTVGGYSLANTNPVPASVMVARRIDRPLYIILDGLRVGDTWALETPACSIGDQGCARFSLFAVQTFVRRDLKTAMEEYFSRVEVVDSVAALPSTPHVVADVKIDNIRLNDVVRGIMTHRMIEMTWSFAFRLSEQGDYAYSFGGVASSNDSYPTFEAGCTTLIENAIPAMLRKWVEEGGYAAMLESSSAS